MVETFTIGRLAEAAGVNVETVRYYERRGLLAQPRREGSGYRRYSASELWRLQFIRRAKELGFTLAEIAELLGATDGGSTAGVLAATRDKIEAVEARQRHLEDLRRRLVELSEICARGDAADCINLRVQAERR